MRISTLLFLVQKRDDGKVSKVCLGMKKAGFGAGKWNGAGGKVEEGETIEKAAIRETKEEFGVRPRVPVSAGVLEFYFVSNPEWNQIVHVFVSEIWEGELKESEEMRPCWFGIEDVPFTEMWPDDIFWLPQVLDGEAVRAVFTFGEGDAILEQKVTAFIPA